MTGHASIGHITLRALLGVHSDELVGTAREPTDDDQVGFAVDRLRHGGTIVTMQAACDLSFVLARCRQVANTILDQGDDAVSFTRDQGRVASRLAELDALRGRWRPVRPHGPAGLDLRHCQDPASAKQEVLTAQQAIGRISVANLVRAQSTALLGPSRKTNPDLDPRTFTVAELPNNEIIVTLPDNRDLGDVLFACTDIVGDMLESHTGRIIYTREQTTALTG